MDKAERRALYDARPHYAPPPTRKVVNRFLKPVKDGLTVKQLGFVNDYVGTFGDHLEAVKRNYPCKNYHDRAYKLMSNPKVIEAIETRIAEQFPDGMLVERHKALLYKDDPDGQPDTAAVSKALDMAYKLKGSYAAEKQTVMNVNVDVKPTDENMEAIRLEFENRIKEQLAQPYEPQ